MGTRCDFYVGTGVNAEWLGSYPFDGYPDGIPDAIKLADSESGFREAVAEFLALEPASSTLPAQGWPWPWEDSRTTDYAYAWDDGLLYASSFGTEWFVVDTTAEEWGEPDDEGDGEKIAVFPDMTAIKAVTYGPRSGLIVIE